MSKKEFIKSLKVKLKSFNDVDVDDAITYYSDLIDDKIENENISEDKAVSSLGDINKIARDISIDMLASKKENKKGAGSSILIVLAVLFASPVLIPLAIVTLVLYLVIIIVWLSLIIGFGAGALGALLGFFSAFLNISQPYFMFFQIGVCLIVFTLLGLMIVLITKYGYKAIKSLISVTARIICKKRG